MVMSGTPGQEIIVLHLYIAGMSTRSLKAVETVKRICSQELEGRYELTIVDIYQNPELAKQNQILAVPSLVKTSPLPMRIVIGDLSNPEKVRGICGLPSANQSEIERS